MKLFLVTVVFLLSIYSAYSATFSPKSLPTDERLAQLTRIHSSGAVLFDDCASAVTLSLESRKVNETWPSVIKQALQNTHVISGGVRIEQVNVTGPLERFDLVSSAFDGLPSSQNITRSERDLFRSFEGVMTLLRGDYYFFKGEFSNEEMQSSFLVVLDLHELELSIFAAGKCY